MPRAALNAILLHLFLTLNFADMRLGIVLDLIVDILAHLIATLVAALLIPIVKLQLIVVLGFSSVRGGATRLWILIVAVFKIYELEL